MTKPLTQAREDAMAAFLSAREAEIVSSALEDLRLSASGHYRSMEEPELALRLQTLLRVVADGMGLAGAPRMERFARELAAQRHEDGYSIQEVLMAFGALERSIWNTAHRDLEPRDFAALVSRVTWLIGSGKDTLAVCYVGLATQERVSQPDLPALARGLAAGEVAPG